MSVSLPGWAGRRACIFSFVLASMPGVTSSATAQLALTRTLEGPIDYVTTGATLRTSSNSSGPCDVNTSAAATLSGIPAGATITISRLTVHDGTPHCSDAGASWSYTPVSGGCSAPAGFDACVQRIRWILVGSLPADAMASSGTLTYTARVR